MANPIGEFITWLPSELEYSARTSGYAAKIERSRRDPHDHLSLYGFLENEWNIFQSMRLNGNIYQPFLGMSAQLRLAKFAAIFFDKAAMGIWFENGAEPSAEAYHRVARAEADIVKVQRPWQNLHASEDYFERIMHKPFNRTIFGRNTPNIMQAICEAADNPGNNAVVIERLRAVSTALGGVAVGCFEAFSRNELNSNQYVLPLSQLAA